LGGAGGACGTGIGGFAALGGAGSAGRVSRRRIAVPSDSVGIAGAAASLEPGAAEKGTSRTPRGVEGPSPRKLLEPVVLPNMMTSSTCTSIDRMTARRIAGASSVAMPE